MPRVITTSTQTGIATDKLQSNYSQRLFDVRSIRLPIDVEADKSMNSASKLDSFADAYNRLGFPLQTRRPLSATVNRHWELIESSKFGK
jgi:hypothetical protein